jgi:hypothetical protein
MGYRNRYDVTEIRRGICAMQSEMNDMGQSGFITWPIKKQMYQLKWLIEESLESASRYAGEDEFVKEHEQQRLIDILKK